MKMYLMVEVENTNMGFATTPSEAIAKAMMASGIVGRVSSYSRYIEIPRNHDWVREIAPISPAFQLIEIREPIREIL